MIVGLINSSLKTSIIFIIGVVYGITIGVSGIIDLSQAEVFGVSLAMPLVIAPLFVVLYFILFFKNDKIEQIKDGYK